MGTRILERTTTNSLCLESIDCSGFIRFGVNGLLKSTKEKLTNDKEEEQEGVVFVLRSMDRFLEKQTAESIKHTMQTQEATFKQQVRELHRIYNTQKMMMDQLKHRSQYCTNDNKSQTIQNVVEARKTATNYIEESELELTLSIGMSSSTNKDMDNSSTTSFRSLSDNCNNRGDNNNNNSNNPTYINSSNNQESSSSTPKSSSSTSSLDREKKRPHWLFQGLSINRTS